MTGPIVGLAKAAELCGVSVATIRRKRDTLVTLGATPSNTGWKIPISALIGAGLMPNMSPPAGVTHVTPATPVGTPSVTPSVTPVSELEDKVDALEKALAEARQKLAIADAVMAEKERVILVQERALALLEAAPQPKPVPVEPVSEATTVTKKRWWSRS